MSHHDPAEILRRSRVLFTRDEVNEAVGAMAAEINAAYGDTPLILVTVLTGGMLPASWLATRLEMPLQFDFVHATRYRGETRGGELVFRVHPRMDFSGRHVLIVDDIYDEGRTLAALDENFRGRGAASVRSAVLTRKDHERSLDHFEADFVGLDVPDVYVFGCGMDAYEEWRHLHEIRALDLD